MKVYEIIDEEKKKIHRTDWKDEGTYNANKCGFNSVLDLEVSEKKLKNKGWVDRMKSADIEMTSWANGRRAMKNELITHGCLNHKEYLKELFKTHAKQLGYIKK